MTGVDQALDALLAADPAVQRATLQHEICKRVIQVRNGLPKLSPAHCAAAMTDQQWQDVLHAQLALGAWIEQVRAARAATALRLVR